MKHLLLALALFTGLTGSAVAGNIYQCKSASGAVEFRDSPCGGTGVGTSSKQASDFEHRVPQHFDDVVNEQVHRIRDAYIAEHGIGNYLNGFCWGVAAIMTEYEAVQKPDEANRAAVYANGYGCNL